MGTFTPELKVFLKKKILNDNSLIDYEEERKQIFSLLERTVTMGESNSALLIGPRSSGKTGLINNILKELEELKYFSGNAVLVQLHGLVHTDDRLALKSIALQMNLENSMEGKVFGTFSENLSFLMACLKSGKKHTAKSVIFILDEFQFFCAHHNQTLLYNLFDVSQSAQTPVCVLGVTCRLDVIELMEKRVKSRFSHRQIFLFPKYKNDDASLFAGKIIGFLSLPENKSCKVPISFQKQWNVAIKKIFNDGNFHLLVKRLQEVTLNVDVIKNISFMMVSNLSDEKLEINLKHFQEQLNLLETDEIVQSLQDLCVVELCLMIAMKHHSEIYDNQAMNFEMILNRYLKFANTNSHMQFIQRPVIRKAFEHVKNVELISMLSSGSGKTQDEYQMFKLLVASRQIMEAISSSPGIPTEVEQWSNSSFG